jgi:alkanesulfonate monooxygenase SsuD/methylene tetrahydromethanopterin reductase-like flavin-dependent oxidoreductase (luciferase family)
VNSKLHLGVTPWQLSSKITAERLCAQAEQAEAWGFDSFFLPESHFVDNSPIPDPMLLLAAIAGRTRRLQLGTTSYLLPIRNAILAAEQVACLDQLCEGRLILGLGRGFQADMLDVFGVSNADKRERFSETLATMLAAWRGEPLNGEDEALILSPRPHQVPHPPLWVAAFGPRAIDQCARLGLPYLASPVESHAELEANFQLHRGALESHGQPVPETVAVMRTVFVSDDNTQLAAVRESLAALPAQALRRSDRLSPEDWCILGSAAVVRQQLERLRETLGMTHLVAVRPRVSGIERQALEHSFGTLASVM